jgi:hypothetical protein
MIGSDSGLRPASTAFKQKPLSDLSGLTRPRGIADSETMAKSNNLFASALQKANGREMYSGQGPYADRAGFSRDKKQAMMAGNQEAAGFAQGARDAASVQADDQMFNSNLDFQYKQMVQSRLLANKRDALERQGLTWQQMFNQRKNNQSRYMNNAQNQQGVWQNMAQSLLSG